MDMLYSKIGKNVGKTADAETGQTTDEHRTSARIQTATSKAIMKAMKEIKENDM